ncbi:hypothetical protein ES703_40958 [subsurface metagenome]
MCISRTFYKSSSSDIRYRATESGEPKIGSSENPSFGSTDHFQCGNAEHVRGENGYFIAALHYLLKSTKLAGGYPDL